MKNWIKGLAVSLGLVGILACGCEKGIKEPKGLKLWGYVEQPPRILFSNGLLRPNQVYLDVKLDCVRDYACKDLDLKYHGENGTSKSVSTLLEIGSDVSSLKLKKGDSVYFVLTEGFTESGRTAVGDPLYWINRTNARGKLLESLYKE